MFPQHFLNPTFYTPTNIFLQFFSPAKYFCLTLFTQKKRFPILAEKYFKIKLRRHNYWSKYEIISLNRKPITAWKVSVFRDFLVQMWENTDQKNSEYGHCSLGVLYLQSFQCTDTLHWSFLQLQWCQRIQVHQKRSPAVLLIQLHNPPGIQRLDLWYSKPYFWVFWVFTFI